MAGDPARNRRTRAERLVRNFQENGIQWLLEHPGNVRDLLGLTGEALVAEIDLDRMHLVRGTFITRDYRRRASDVVLVAPTVKVLAASSAARRSWNTWWRPRPRPRPRGSWDRLTSHV